MEIILFNHEIENHIYSMNNVSNITKYYIPHCYTLGLMKM